MVEILIEAAERYAYNLKVILQEASNDNSPIRQILERKIFLNFSNTEHDYCENVVGLLTKLVLLVPEIAKFVIIKENLLSDRSLAASAFCYLITPFDIIPDENDLFSAIDDALICFRMAQSLAAPSDELNVLIGETRSLVREVDSGLPVWMAAALNDAIKNMAYQQKVIESATVSGGV